MLTRARRGAVELRRDLVQAGGVVVHSHPRVPVLPHQTSASELRRVRHTLKLDLEGRRALGRDRALLALLPVQGAAFDDLDATPRV